MCFFFFKQKTAYEVRNCDWSSDVCSSDLLTALPSIGERASKIISVRNISSEISSSGGNATTNVSW